MLYFKMATTDLQSKINRAVRAWLVSQNAVAATQCIAAPASFGRTLPLTVIETGDGMAILEQPGNFHFADVRITMEDSAAVQPNMADPQTPRANANAHWTAVANALSQSNDNYTLLYTAQQITIAGRALATSNPADDADMADFTMLWWEPAMQGSAKKAEDGTFWQREIAFGCIACNTALAP